MTSESSTETKESPGNAIDVVEFVRRVGDHCLKNRGSRLIFFLGAGCSISSGIPSGADLARAWLARLHYLKTEPGQSSFVAWAEASGYPGAGEAPGRYYSKVASELFRSAEARRREIERLTSEKHPSYGYALFARMLTHPDLAGQTNVVLTTNFDDLLADAIYLHTAKRALVLGHEALFEFASPSPFTPIIVKLHGHSQLAPKNTKHETIDQSPEIENVLAQLPNDSWLIFVGYSGSDPGVALALSRLHKQKFGFGIYWVGRDVPDSEEWRQYRGMQNERFTHVDHQDFDQLMLLLAEELRISPPNLYRLPFLRDGYADARKRMVHSIDTSVGPDAPILSVLATHRAAWAGMDEPSGVSASPDSDDLDACWQWRLIADHPNDAALRLNAAESAIELGRRDVAQHHLEHAHRENPHDAAVLGAYAFLLAHNADGANRHRSNILFEEALVLDPHNQINLANYAQVLLGTGTWLTSELADARRRARRVLWCLVRQPREGYEREHQIGHFCAAVAFADDLDFSDSADIVDDLVDAFPHLVKDRFFLEKLMNDAVPNERYDAPLLYEVLAKMAPT